MTTMPVRAPDRRPAGPRSRPTASEPQRTASPARRELPRLRVVRAQDRPRTRAPFVALCVAILAGALLGALLLNTAMAQTSFAIHDRQIELARLSERQQALAQSLAIQDSPERLAERARAAGMVPAPPPAFIDLADGTIVGESVPAEAAG